jgi:hypothetical protein
MIETLYEIYRVLDYADTMDLLSETPGKPGQ